MRDIVAMKLGWSSYCFKKAMDAGDMTPLDVVQWIADHGGEHVEIATFGLSLIDNLELADAIASKASELGIELSNYCIAGNLVQDSEEAYQTELARIRTHVDLTHRLGIKRMRCDVLPFRADPMHMDYPFFEAHLADFVRGLGEIADYALGFGITVAIENHGFCLQASERVQRVLFAVNRSNFKTVVDIGNFLCVDEDPLVGFRNNIPYASMVHFKDFYIRPATFHGGEGWFPSKNGRQLRGAILGEGDMDIVSIVQHLKQSGYDGCVSLEFEGMEDCVQGSRKGMENLKLLLGQA